MNLREIKFRMDSGVAEDSASVLRAAAGIASAVSVFIGAVKRNSGPVEGTPGIANSTDQEAAVVNSDSGPVEGAPGIAISMGHIAAILEAIAGATDVMATFQSLPRGLPRGAFSGR